MQTLMVVMAAAGMLAQQAVSGGQAKPAPSGPPATEVYIASLTVNGGAWTLGAPENVSNSPGYDNQPFFTPDAGAVLFTSGRDTKLGGGTPQTDIYRYDFARKALTQVTSTPESEYSPTVTPDGKGISVIRVEADQTQRLWRFTSDGKNPTLVLKDLKPVGYHAWLDPNTLALFILGGQGSPATLQVANVKSGTAEIVASDIGQSVLKIPSGGASFVQQGSSGPMISQVTLEGAKPQTKALTAPVPGARQVQLAWTPDGTLLMAHNGWLHAWKPGDSAWRAVVDLESLGLKGVTRLAVSPKGDKLAIVAQ